MGTWQVFIFQPLVGFILIFLGSALLLSEVLVKGKLILGLLGFLTISTYFYAHINEGLALWMGILFLVGILLLVVDGKFIGDGTLSGIGLILMIVAIALPSPSFFYGLAVVTAFILGICASFLSLKFLPKREVWTKLMLKDTLSSEQGYNTMKESYKELIGREGIAETDFRPSGTIKIDDKLYSAVADGKWIKKGSALIVTEVNGIRILVQEKEQES